MNINIRAISIVFLLHFLSGSGYGLEFEEIIENSVYTSVLENRILNAEPEFVKNIINNFPHIIDLVNYTNPEFFISSSPRLTSYDFNGIPDSFTIESTKSRLSLTRTVISENEITFHGEGESRVFIIPVSGDIAIKIRIDYGKPADNQCLINTVMAFRPKSNAIAAAIKPVVKVLSEEMDAVSAQMFEEGEAMLAKLAESNPDLLKKDYLRSQVSALYKENKKLTNKILEGSVAGGRKDGDNGQRYISSEKKTSSLIAFLAFAIIIGTAVGFFVADRTRKSRMLRVAKRIREIIALQKGADREIIKTLKQTKDDRDYIMEAAEKLLQHLGEKQ